MRLSALLGALPPELASRQVIGPEGDAADPIVRGIAYDSRAIAPGDVFFALRGSNVDGHDYLEQALDLGAAVLCVEELPKDFDLRGRTAVLVPDTRRAMAPAATAFFGAPANDLLMLGVTGTNGKTSTTYLCESILCQAGRRVGLLGTVEVRFGSERQRANNTTPESLDLQQTLRDMRTAGVDAAVMEVSSHGLELGRVLGCHFDIACFTNLTQDHLDFHGDMETYRVSKELLFRDHLTNDACAVVNVDDPAGQSFVEAATASGARSLRVSRHDASAEIFLESAEVEIAGSQARVRTPEGSFDVFLPLVGDFNLENMLVACGAGLAAGASLDVIRAGVEACPQVPGRMERVGADLEGAPTVLVDYAHTPDAVEKVVSTLRPLCTGRLIAVFGCGGDRDRAKRPLMAQAVARHADRIVATSDNPRTEDPERILDDVVEGLSELTRVEADAFDTAEHSYLRVADRREAIAQAVAIAGPEDTVVIAGKGHEDYQIIGRERLPFDDRQEARRALLTRGGGE
jgi:UDP-N-acetylmuramoyl-L-alanyl-D-glutamate--2,6-diaminopimelate ligase